MNCDCELFFVLVREVRSGAIEGSGIVVLYYFLVHVLSYLMCHLMHFVMMSFHFQYTLPYHNDPKILCNLLCFFRYRKGSCLKGKVYVL